MRARRHCPHAPKQQRRLPRPRGAARLKGAARAGAGTGASAGASASHAQRAASATRRVPSAGLAAGLAAAEVVGREVELAEHLVWCGGGQQQGERASE